MKKMKKSALIAAALMTAAALSACDPEVVYGPPSDYNSSAESSVSSEKGPKLDSVQNTNERENSQ